MDPFSDPGVENVPYRTNGTLYTDPSGKRHWNGQAWVDDCDDELTDDGGPGSGNWGHKGRPGKVGGSGKGGGKHYRGGRGDIHYYSSKIDWANGLTGEKGNKADKLIEKYAKSAKPDENPTEVAEREIMTTGDLGDRADYVTLKGEARLWDERKDRFLANLSDDERKVFDYLDGKTDKMSDENLGYYLDLKNKAMEGSTSGVPMPDDLAYEAGVKEKPAPAPAAPKAPRSRKSTRCASVRMAPSTMKKQGRHFPMRLLPVVLGLAKRKSSLTDSRMVSRSSLVLVLPQ